jgi:hypothetical protein
MIRRRRLSQVARSRREQSADQTAQLHGKQHCWPSTWLQRALLVSNGHTLTLSFRLSNNSDMCSADDGPGPTGAHDLPDRQPNPLASHRVQRWIAIATMIYAAAALAAVVVSAGAIIVSANTAKGVQKEAEDAVQRSNAQRAGYAATVLISRIQQEKQGLVYIWNSKRLHDSFVPLSAFALSLSDATTLLAAKPPANALSLVSGLYGKFATTYTILASERGPQRVRVRTYLHTLCSAMGYATNVEEVLKKIVTDELRKATYPSDAALPRCVSRK